MRTSRRHSNGGKIDSHGRTLQHARTNGPAPAPGTPSASTSSPNTPTRRPAAHPAAIELKPRTPEVPDAAIAEAAYFLWQQRGGDPIANWLEAEATLKANLNR